MALTGKARPDDRTSWGEALALYRGQLSFYLDYLIECDCSDELLAEVEAEVRDRSVPDEFKQRFMLRVLVQQVIRRMRENTQIAKTMDGWSPDSPISAGSAPFLERLIYFLRDILEYSTRNTSLLVGITDAHVEKLLLFARTRIDMREGPVSTDIEDPNGGYFRWKFADLHLS
jgi:hypothetical protein